MRKGQTKANICITCKLAGGLCSWSDRGQPVPGWTAEPIRLRANGRRYHEESYRITGCPLYTPRREGELSNGH